MVQFWLDNLAYLVNVGNFNFKDTTKPMSYIKILNIIAMVSLITGLLMVALKKKVKYFGLAIVVMALTILIKSNINPSGFANVSNGSNGSNVSSKLSNAFDTGVHLVKNVNGNDSSGMKNILYVNEAFNFNKGDIIALANNNSIMESNVITDVKYTIESNSPVIILLNDLKNNYSKLTTKILKVADSAPNITTGPDGNMSIEASKFNNVSDDPMKLATMNYPKFNLPNQNRFDWNLEQSSMVPGGGDNYVYQGQPYGPLECRKSNVTNPMGTINVTEYDAPPTMYGTCNVAEQTNGQYNDTVMTENQEATVPQSVNDLLFHKGNSQMLFSPVPVDTIPDNQTAFANWLYRSPTNLVNAKYASIFVNDPEKYKMVAKLAKATGTEGGSGNR